MNFLVKARPASFQLPATKTHTHGSTPRLHLRLRCLAFVLCCAAGLPALVHGLVLVLRLLVLGKALPIVVFSCVLRTSPRCSELVARRAVPTLASPQRGAGPFFHRPFHHGRRKQRHDGGRAWHAGPRSRGGRGWRHHRALDDLEDRDGQLQVVLRQESCRTFPQGRATPALERTPRLLKPREPRTVGACI